MKRYNAVRSLFCLFLSAVMLVTPLCALAAGQATAGISAKIYDNGQKQMVSTNEVWVGQVVYIPISISGNRPAGGFEIDLEYDRQLLDFMPGSSIWLVPHSADCLTANLTSTGANVLWESGTAATLSGEIYYAAFKVRSISENTLITITLTVGQLFDSDMDDISVSYSHKQVSFELLTSTLSPSELAPFQKLKTVIYPDSKADIEAADTAFQALGSAKQQLLKKSYSEIYNDYITARSRYNRLVEDAAEQAILDELASFADAHSEVLKLTPETVGLGDSDAVALANKALKNEDTVYSKRAEVLLNKAYGELINALQNAIEELQDIEKEIADYKEAYSNLFDLDEKTVQMDLDSYAEMLEEAISVYDGKSDALKSALKAQYDSMVKMQAYCAEQLALEEASLALAKEVSAYQAQWLNVLLLNTATVSVGDETAINMAITAYNSLSDEAKAHLAPRIKNLEAMLKLIEGMKNQPETNPGGNNGGNPGNPGNVQTPTETVVVEKDKLINRINYMTKTSPVFLIVLIILLVLSAVSFILPFALGIFGKKKKKGTEKEDSK